MLSKAINEYAYLASLSQDSERDSGRSNTIIMVSQSVLRLAVKSVSFRDNDVRAC